MNKKMVPGTRISFSYKGQSLKGTIVNEDSKRLTVKLSTGYNITVSYSELVDVEEEKILNKTQHRDKNSAGKRSIERKLFDSKKPGRAKRKSGLPRITILHTGGTIASKVDYATGAVVAKFTAEEILQLFPDLSKIADISSVLLANIQSEMMRFGHWNTIARGVEKAIKDGAEGVIVTQGTDTLHMTSAALAFALKNLTVPVIVVGSQRSSDRPSSDSQSNLLCAASFIAQEKKSFKSVGICMHEGIESDDCVILPATRTRKMHTSRRDAFKAINDLPYARIKYRSLRVEHLRSYEPLDNVGEHTLKIAPFNEKLKIGLFHLHPQIYAEELKTYERFDGLVIELFGIGHAPTMVTDEKNKEHEEILKELKLLAKKIPVVGAPQTIYGRVDMDVYSPGRQLQEIGILGQGCDMTPETAFVKLAWLLSNYSPSEARKLYSKNLRGEISERSDERGFEK